LSKYSRTVAPTTPVPDRRKMMREPSAKMKRMPCGRRARRWLDTRGGASRSICLGEPSTGEGVANHVRYANKPKPTKVDPRERPVSA